MQLEIAKICSTLKKKKKTLIRRIRAKKIELKVVDSRQQSFQRFLQDFSKYTVSYTLQSTNFKSEMISSLIEIRKKQKRFSENTSYEYRELESSSTFQHNKKIHEISDLTKYASNITFW